jgi:hypothetical protein
VRITEERGRLLNLPVVDDAGSVRPTLLLTFHPTYLLRLQEAPAAADAYEKFVADLHLAKLVGAEGDEESAHAAALLIPAPCQAAGAGKKRVKTALTTRQIGKCTRKTE